MPEAEPPDDACPACFDNGWVWDCTVKPAVKVDCPEGCEIGSRKAEAA